MLRKNATPVIVVAAIALIIAIGLAFGLGTTSEWMPGPASTSQNPLFEATSQAVCQQCHAATGTEQQNVQLEFVAAPPTTFEEPFTSDRTSLTWQTVPGFSPDPLKSVKRQDAPDHDGWVGLVTNETFGGFASLSYAGDANLSDYSVESWIYTDVTKDQRGPLHGIAIRIDPNPNAGRFYRLAAQFVAEPKITFSYVGKDINNFPIHLRTWGAQDIPGGVPQAGGWHKMRIQAIGENFRAYWDDQELPGGPIVDNRIQNGYFGVYANFVGARQVARTPVDAIVVQSEQ